MPKNSESGHVVNVSNFSELITFVTGYGEAYNPSNNLISLSSLQGVSANAARFLGSVNSAISACNTAVSGREILFAPLSKLVTRAMSLLKSSGVSEQVYDQVNTVARKVKGTRASVIIKPEPTAEGADSKPAPKQVSAAQMSYDSRAENFAKLILLLADIPEYNPNEPDLNVDSLGELDAVLKAKNNDVIAAEVALSNARIARNVVLYSVPTGLCEVATAVKNYVKALFGTTSPQFKQISKLQFKKMK